MNILGFGIVLGTEFGTAIVLTVCAAAIGLAGMIICRKPVRSLMAHRRRQNDMRKVRSLPRTELAVQVLNHKRERVRDCCGESCAAESESVIHRMGNDSI